MRLIEGVCVIAVVSVVLGALQPSDAQEPQPLLFDTSDHGGPDALAPIIAPWKTIDLDPEYGGIWVVAGDVDNDGEPEIVSAENSNEGDVHYTSAVACQKLDGTVLWQWGDPDIGRKELHHDVACQIHDWDGDGKVEVVLLTKGALVELDGATGEEKRRFPIPDEATDCLVFCDLAGKGRPEDVLVKTRYTQIWAYDRSGALLWTVTEPGGARTAHQPRPIDLDGDGRDEIFAGYAMLNADGSVRWVFKSNTIEKLRGHLDCARVIRKGATPADFRIALTCCGGESIAVIDGNGTPLWERSGHHFESVQVGRVFPGREGLQLLVDIDHRPQGESPLWVFDEDGTHLGQIMTDYCRIHALVDWTGDGYDEIVVGTNRGMYSREGVRIGAFDAPAGSIVQIGDMTGDGVPDVILNGSAKVCVFRNEAGKKPETPAPLGTGVNVTLY